jgi:hypothetical protein
MPAVVKVALPQPLRIWSTGVASQTRVLMVMPD